MIIPLYGFNHYHSASNCEENTEGFIGRDSIIDKLSAWLDAPKGKTAYSGAYLITGYRGMGKSSFVHKAVAKLSPKPHGFIEKIRRFGKPKYVTVTVNVGNELLTTKELLGMVCKVAAKKLETEATGSKLTKPIPQISNFLLTFFLGGFMFASRDNWVFHVQTVGLGLFVNFIGHELKAGLVKTSGKYGAVQTGG